ncbi:tetratricopeptide repeat protein [Streptomyces sp. NPDC093111]|uniref:tetratricopeptide repeat protein n=1 Tax=Streptomyces sp. NPDC093111 TaxID=3154978 RepID=UPI003417ACE5
MLFRDSDMVQHIRQKARVSGEGRVVQAGRDQVNIEGDVVNVYPGAHDPSEFARVSVTPPKGLHPRHLHGRDAVLRALGADGIEPLRGSVTVLHGMGGVGKSAVALSLASIVQDNGIQVFWVRASDAEGIPAALRQIAAKLVGSENHARQVAAGVLAPVDLVWEALDASSRPWLLVIDGADAPAEIERTLEPAWLRGSMTGAVLVTTRLGSPDLWPAEASMIKLEPLDPASGTELLLDLAGGSEAQWQAADLLSRRLGGIPLALRLAGRCISQPLSPLRDFATFHAALDKDFANVVDRAVDASVRPRSDGDARDLVMQTWEVSLDALEWQGVPHVRSIMRVLSCWAAQSVPVELLSPKVLLRTHGSDEGPWDPLAVERALSALHAVGLIDIVDESPVIQPVEGSTFYHWTGDVRTHRCVVVHPLVSEVNAAKLMGSPGRASAWAAAARCIGAMRGGWGAPSSAGLWQLLVPHLAATAARLPADLPELFETIVETQMYLSRYLRLSGQYESGHRTSRALHDRLSSISPSDGCRFQIVYECAEWAWHMSRLEEANALVSSACHLAERTFGKQNFHTLMARELAIAIHTELGNLSSGELLARELCQELEDLPQFPYLSMQAHHHLATTLRESGRLEEAEVYSRKAVGLMDGLNVAPFTRAVLQHELGVIWWHRGHLDRARRLLERVLLLQKKSLPPWHPSILVTRYDIASIRGIEGNLVRALFEFMDIQLIEQDVLGDDHRNTLQTKHQVGQLLVQLKELDRAEAILDQVEEGYRSGGLLGRTADVLSTRHERVHILAQRGRHREAHREWRQILAEEQRSLSAEHPSTLRTHYNWAVCWARLGFPALARAEMRKVLAARRRVLGPNHYETLEAVQTLADLGRLPAKGWSFGGTGRANIPRNRQERRSKGGSQGPTPAQ